MSNGLTGKALRIAAIAGMFVSASALAGCSSLSGLGFDRTATGSVNASSDFQGTQPMPKTLAAPTKVAAGPFIPPNNIGGGSSAMAMAPLPSGTQQLGTITSEDLPSLNSNNGSNQMMPAVQPLSPVPATPRVADIPASPTLVSVPSDAYVHVVESGESLYTIARRYNVTAQAIIQANGFNSPDKIFVSQKLVIPGKASQLAALGPKGTKPAAGGVTPIDKPVEKVASVDPAATTPLAPVKPLAAKPAVETPVAKVEPAKPLEQPKSEPVLSGADKFRWPISGRVITDFANSKGTGINIEAPEGAAVRAAENGQVIYAGSGVEGYGNLILIRHPNGYVSAYAHLQQMNVAKGTVVNRGDSIGAAGKTGSVSKPQLHFELRKGATPVDPLPLLAS
ncbi:MAG: M23 family metallopeptidase [Alphaproteobacteria bacterium]|nr:MAG: M23 family metallopeptidase [Alphaproteobacteria bacterium]